MKNWVGILMWAGLGGGIGFFAGYQAGRRSERNEELARDAVNELQNASEAMSEYSGDDGYSQEDAEMPVDIPEIGDEEEIEISQLHPQHLVPQIITEDEFNHNEWGYNLENMIFYEDDRVLYDETTGSVIEDPDEVIGCGTLIGFTISPNNPIETLYVKNETFRTLFRIDRVDGAYGDILGGRAPEYEEEDD